MPSSGARAGNSVEQVLATRAQLDHHFKNLGLRDAEFRKQKLVLQERALKMERKNRNTLQCDTDDAPPSLSRTNSSPQLAGAGYVSSPKKLPSSPSRRPNDGNQSVPGLSHAHSLPDLGCYFEPWQVSTLGMCRNRFGAGFPVSQHPAVHPGVLRLKSNLEGGLDMHSSFSRGAPGGMPDGPTSPLFSQSSGRSQTGKASPSNAGRSPASPLQRSPSGCPQGLGLGEDPLWAGGPSEEEKLFADGEGGSPGILRPPAPPAALDRFGDMIALLGPRFKTLPHAAIWERAVLEGTTTPLQRKMQRMHRPAGDGVLAKKRIAPEDVPDMDTEKATRKSWLTIRRKQRENEMRSLP